MSGCPLGPTRKTKESDVLFSNRQLRQFKSGLTGSHDSTASCERRRFLLPSQLVSEFQEGFKKCALRPVGLSYFFLVLCVTKLFDSETMEVHSMRTDQDDTRFRSFFACNFDFSRQNASRMKSIYAGEVVLTFSTPLAA